MTDAMGDRLKSYEAMETEAKFIPTLPIYARIDGRGFSRFTRGMKRPYDENMASAIVRTTSMLVEATNALIGYTQSDEISLVWMTEKPDSDIFFSGKKQKMTSVLASMATAYFTRAIIEIEAPFSDYARRMPHFDCRVFQLPSQEEAANCFLWRERDATKNAITMAASHYYSHKQLQGKNGGEKQEMLFQVGINFNDYPASFKRGTFVRRVTEERVLTDNERNKIPEKKRPPEGQTFTRSRIAEINMPSFGKVMNRVGVIFKGQEPFCA